MMFKANYATALALAKNASGCLSVLAEISHEQDDYVQKLLAAVHRWQRSLGWRQRFSLRWYGKEPDTVVTLDFQPGQLVVKREERPAA